MPRSKTKSVTKDGILHAADKGCIEMKSCRDRAKERASDGYRIRDIDKLDAVSLEMSHCTAFLMENEALQTITSLARAGYRQWGDTFLADVRGWIDAVDAR